MKGLEKRWGGNWGKNDRLYKQNKHPTGEWDIWLVYNKKNMISYNFNLTYLTSCQSRKII
jgi:hypothetical protein